MTPDTMQSAVRAVTIGMGIGAVVFILLLLLGMNDMLRDILNELRRRP